MRVALIAHARFAIRQPYSGGLEAHTHQLVNELVRQGHEVTLFAKFGSYTSATLVPIFWNSQFTDKNPLWNQAYKYALKRIQFGQFDAIINNSLSHVPLQKHTTTIPHMLTIFHTPPLPRMITELERDDTAINRTYIAVSDFTAAQWQPYCTTPVHVVSNGIDLSGWLSASTAPSTPRAAWVGRITPEKGLHIALQTCIKMQLPLTVGGCVADKTYFKAVILPLLQHPLVTYVGHVDSKTVNTIYRQASVALVTPLWDEPFGLVAIEALAAGTPVAALCHGGLASIIKPAIGALADDDSVAALQKAIYSALQKDRTECSQYAHQQFTLQKMVECYLQYIPLPSNQPLDDDVSWVPIP